MAKHYVLAMLCIMAQIMFNPAWAEVTSPTTVTSTTSQDAIQTFVKSDFATRRAMLNQWPASIEQLDQLVAYIDQNELYTDSSGHTYILKNDEKLLSYPQLQAIDTWPSDLSQVTLVNTLRKALNFGQAKVKLNSDDASQRLAAVDILENNLDELDVATVKQLYLNEKSEAVKARLAQLKARLDFNSSDEFTKIEAVKVLADSNRPDVLALINQSLEQPQSNPALKAALVEAQNKIKTRIQISEWSGHVFSGLSTASILLLAALGLAITYGLLGVINMAHGELIMIGAYTTYVIQSFLKRTLQA
jgi:urea transport system permease protein